MEMILQKGSGSPGSGHPSTEPALEGGLCLDCHFISSMPITLGKQQGGRG